MIGCLCIHGLQVRLMKWSHLQSICEKATDWIFSVPTLPGHGEDNFVKRDPLSTVD